MDLLLRLPRDLQFQVAEMVGREPDVEVPNDDGDIQIEFDKAILRELYRKAEANLDYVNSVVKLRAIFDARVVDMSMTTVPVEIYREWCVEARRLFPKVHKFRDRLADKRGVAVSVRCVKVEDSFIFKEKTSLQLCVPDVIRCVPQIPTSIFGLLSMSITQQPDLDEEQKDDLVEDVFRVVVASNRTGNHYRNHYVRANNPYGHSPSSGA